MKKNLRKIISVAVFMLLMLIINKILHFVLVDDSESFTRIMMHELYTEEENIDVLYLGSSHCYRSLIPEITDVSFNANTFNAGSSLQQLDATYALLVEAAKENDLKEVYVELYYGVNGEIFANRTDMTATYLISDYMKPSLNKLELIFNAGPSDHYMNSVVLAKRNWEKIFSPGYMLNTVRKKTSASYRNYDYLTINGDSYRAKGYMANDLCFTGSSNYQLGSENAQSFYDNYISDDCRKYLVKIIDFCQKKDIRLTFFSAPMTEFSLMSLGNYDSYIKQVKDFATQYNVPYYDFNLCKSEYLSLTNDDFIDPQHLNTAGATKFSGLFCDFFSGKVSEEIFHNTFSEKLETFGSQILGISITELHSYNSDELYPELYFDHDNYRYWALAPMTGGSSMAQYYIEKETANGQTTLFQNWDGTSFIFAPINESGNFHIQAQNPLTGKKSDKIIFPY